MKKIVYVLLVNFIFCSLSFASEQTIVKDGQKIILNDDGSWKYAEKEESRQGVEGAVYKPGKEVKGYPFYVYKDAGFRGNHYMSTGWMGDWADIKLDVLCKDNPQSGNTCIKVTYTAYEGKRGKKANWAGIYWQDPPQNWGKEYGGYDLGQAKRLTFWARGETGHEVIVEFKVGGIEGGEFRDFDSASIGPIYLTKEWKQYVIELNQKEFNVENYSGVRGENIKSFSRLIGGFAWVTNLDFNFEGAVFYLDEIRFED